jgi:hypothetical protein
MAEQTSSHHRKAFRSVLLCSLLMPALMIGTAHGQNAEETARQRVRIKAYGMFSYINPDFLNDSRNKGFTLGGDIDGFRLLPHTEIGLDLRYSFSTGSQVNQVYYAGGPRLSFTIGRFTPYVDALLGHGKDTFRNPSDTNYKYDVSPAPTVGGGLDYRLNRSWAIRADIQQERWRFSIHQPMFYPLSASVGATYQFHFHSRTGPNL